MFADAEDERQQYTIVIHQVAARLRLDAEPYGDNGAVRIDGEVVTTYEELVDLIVERLTDEDTRRTGPGRSPGRERSTRSSAGCVRRCGRCPPSSART